VPKVHDTNFLSQTVHGKRSRLSSRPIDSVNRIFRWNHYILVHLVDRPGIRSQYTLLVEPLENLGVGQIVSVGWMYLLSRKLEFRCNVLQRRSLLERREGFARLCVLHRRSLLERIGGFDSVFRSRLCLLQRLSLLERTEGFDSVFRCCL
jgi:hypothetical protein